MKEIWTSLRTICINMQEKKTVTEIVHNSSVLLTLADNFYLTKFAWWIKYYKVRAILIFEIKNQSELFFSCQVWTTKILYFKNQTFISSLFQVLMTTLLYDYFLFKKSFLFLLTFPKHECSALKKHSRRWDICD